VNAPDPPGLKPPATLHLVPTSRDPRSSLPKRTAVIALAAAAFVAALILKGRDAGPDSPLTGRAMGTGWTLAWRGDPPPNLRREVAAVLEHWEQVMSSWRADSDLSRHNRGAAASADLARVIARAEAVREASGGAFDHRILEAVHAAGAGPPGTGIDLSGIGKGFAADRVGERLRQLGVTDFVFELGGEVIAGDGEWTVRIERPVPGGSEIAGERTLRRRALATSGNYRQPGHLIDPRTGEPVNRPPSSVTVIAADGATADAWATALFILGPDFRDYPADLHVSWQDLGTKKARR
jgi:thiamine biosynthesis lipoprotein